MQLKPTDWRGPGVDGCELRKSIDSSQSRGSVPIATRQSVQCVLVMVCALGVAEAEGTSQERSQSANALKNRRYNKSTFSAGASSPMMDWMIISPSRVARASLLLPCAQK